jgi:cob(I)alamin adenosyltransferase
MADRPRILIFTGDGKGKTTAALGMALRAAGHGLRSLVVQFVKADASTGELAAARNMPGLEIVQTGLGFVPKPSHPKYPAHKAAAEKGLRMASDAIVSGQYDLIVLDEMTHAITKGLLAEQAVVEAIKQAKPGCCIVLTGRGATEGLMALADTVTEMRSLKHALDQGIPAQKGVEY